MAKDILDELESISKKETNFLHLRMFNDELVRILRATLHRVKSLEEDNKDLQKQIDTADNKVQSKLQSLEEDNKDLRKQIDHHTSGSGHVGEPQ
jgi:cell shape-determining protein MreC